MYFIRDIKINFVNLIDFHSTLLFMNENVLVMSLAQEELRPHGELQKAHNRPHTNKHHQICIIIRLTIMCGEHCSDKR